MPAVRPEMRVGQVELGSFRLLGLIGAGSFASAYLAEQLGTERRAVVKIAHSHLMQRADRSVIKDRFLDEVRASTRVQHPNMATVYTAGETHDGLPAIAMEFVPGDSLEACLERSAPLPHRELVYVPQLASVLASVHRVGIVHRDVSPGNVLVTRDHDGTPRAKLLDFGIAQLEDASRSRVPMGTPRYAAPEQIAGRAVPASDVYGLGAILWWALSGRPYLEEIHSVDALIAHQLEGRRVPDPRDVNGDVPPSLAAIAMELLAHEPAHRPSAADLLDRWPAAVADAREWMRRAGRRRAQSVSIPAQRRALRLLIVDPSPVKCHLVGAFAERLGCEVTMTPNPRDATRGALGTHDIAVLSTELPSVDAAAVARHLREHFPDQRVLFMSSSSERILDCSDAGADIHLTIPGELGRLAEYLETFRRRVSGSDRTPIRTLEAHEPLSRTVVESWRARPPVELREAVTQLIGVMPTLIAQLEDVAAHDPVAASATCALIEERAATLGALHLGRLARSFRMLMEAGELPQPGAFVAEIESEYQRVFVGLMALMRNE